MTPTTSGRAPADRITDRIPGRLYLGYGIGMIGERIFGYTPALLLLVFMTNYLDIPAAMAGTAIFIPKIVVVFVDPLVGILSDRVRSRWGRRRPLMFAGALLIGASFIVLFFVPPIADVWWRTAYMSAMITLGFAAYSLFSVPYLSMASEMSTLAVEHTRLMSVRVIFQAIGLSVGAFAGGIVQWGGGGLGGYRLLAVLFGSLCTLTMLTTVFATARARQCEPDRAPLGLLDQLRMARRNARYLQLLLVNFLQKIGEGIGLGSFAYFVVYYVRLPIGTIGPIVVGTLAGQILSQPLWVMLNTRLGRPVVYTVGVAGWLLTLLVSLTLAGAPLWKMVLIGVASGVTGGGFLGVMLMMLADAISDDAAATGITREGTYSGIWLATEKIGLAVGALLVGSVLGLFHFVSSTGGIDAAEPDTAVLGIAIVYVGVNSLVYAASILPVWRYARLSAEAEAAAMAATVTAG